MSILKIPIYKEKLDDFKRRIDQKVRKEMMNIEGVNGLPVSDGFYDNAYDSALSAAFHYDNFNRIVGWIEIAINENGFSFRLHEITKKTPKGNVKLSDKPERAYKVTLPDVNIGWHIKKYPSNVPSEIEDFLIGLTDAIVSDFPFKNCIYDENEVRKICRIINWSKVTEMGSVV